MITRPKSSIPNMRLKNKLKLETNSKLNQKDNSITLDQSPKISSGKYRTLFEEKKFFSILDVNEKDHLFQFNLDDYPRMKCRNYLN